MNPQSTIPQSPTRRLPRIPPSSRYPAVIDPVDKAMAMLVNEMGFPVADAKWALAKSDTGFGIDPEWAVNVLLSKNKGKQRRSRVISAPPAPPPPVGVHVPISNTAKASSAPAIPTSPALKLENFVHHSQRAQQIQPNEPSQSTEPQQQARLECLDSIHDQQPKIDRMRSRAKGYKILGIGAPSGSTNHGQQRRRLTK